jgi:hypothetical protein
VTSNTPSDDYSPPTIVDLGSVTDITAGGAAGVRLDATLQAGQTLADATFQLS